MIPTTTFITIWIPYGWWSLFKVLQAFGLYSHSLLDLGHLTASEYYYPSRGTECLGVCLTIWRSGRLNANWSPCYCIIIIFIAYCLTSQLHILFLKHHFRIISLSIDSTSFTTVRWVSYCYCSSLMPSLLGLWLTCSDLVQINFGLPSGPLCGMYSFLSLHDSPLWGLWDYLPLHHPAVVPHWELCHCYCQQYANHCCSLRWFWGICLLCFMFFPSSSLTLDMTPLCVCCCLK